MHILMVRFSSMGDVVLQTATINWLKSLFGQDLKLSFVTSQEFVSLIDSHPGLHRVIGFDRRKGEKWKDLIKKIDLLDEEMPIDMIMDLHATLRSWRLKLSFWTVPALTVDKRRWERFLLTKIKSPLLKKLINKKVFGLEPQVERIIKDFADLFQDKQALRRTRSLRSGGHDELTSLPEPQDVDLPRPYIVLAPSASFFYKRWPVNMFVELAERILKETSYHVVILAGPEDSFCDAFNTIQSDRLHNLQGKTSLKVSMNVLSKTLLCIGNDSGMNHITEAYGVPVVTIFGPTDPLFGFSPHGNKSRTISKQLWCKPCSTTGKSKCFRDRPYCMLEISVNEVYESALEIVGSV